MGYKIPNEHKVYVTKHFTFEAAHHLPAYNGKCSRVHGHSYKMDVTVSSTIRDSEDMNLYSESTDAMVLDFTKLKDIVKSRVVDKYDHADLNDYFMFPTAEVMAVHFYNVIKPYIEAEGCNLECVKLWETEDSYAEYRGE